MLGKTKLNEFSYSMTNGLTCKGTCRKKIQTAEPQQSLRLTWIYKLTALVKKKLLELVQKSDNWNYFYKGTNETF